MNAAKRPPPERTAALDELYAQVPDVGCKGLCTWSCGSVAMTPLERQRIAERGAQLPLAAVFDDACPALKDDRCSVYEVRPMVCRLWGAVEGMKCPYGCAPDGGYVSDAQGQRLLGRVMVLSRRAARERP